MEIGKREQAGMADGGLAIEFLQMPESTTRRLRAGGVRTVSDLLEGVSDWEEGVREVVERFQASKSEMGEVDWVNYWATGGNRFYHLAARCGEFERMARVLGHVEVARGNFGNAGACLRRSGVLNLAQLTRRLAEGMEYVPGLGSVKVQDLFDRLLGLAMKPQDEALRESMTRMVAGWRKKLRGEYWALGLEELGLGSRRDVFVGGGIRCLGDLLGWIEGRVGMEVEMPEDDRHHACMVAERVMKSVRADGRLDWYPGVVVSLEGGVGGSGWREKFQPDELLRDLERVHFGGKAKSFEREGIRNLGDLLGWMERGAPEVPAVGEMTEGMAKRIGCSLLHSTGESGRVDWDKFALLAGIPLVPEQPEPYADARKMVGEMGKVFGEIAELLGGEGDRLILAERILKPGGQGLKLWDLSKRLGLSVERVRQKSKALGRMLADGLLRGDYPHAIFRFRSTYADYWKLATGECVRHVRKGARGRKLEEVLAKFAEVWGVRVEELVAYSGVIGLVTEAAVSGVGMAQKRDIGREFGLGRFAALRQKLEGGVWDRPLRELPGLGRVTKAGSSMGVATVGDLLKLAREGKIKPGGVMGREVENFLVKLDKGVMAAGGVENFQWTDYAKAEGLIVMPEDAPGDPEAFLAGFKAALMVAILRLPQAHDVARVFLLRTAQLAEMKMSINQVARACEMTSRQVARLEDAMLKSLRRQLAGGDQAAEEGIFWRDEFLDYCRQVAGQARQAVDIVEFRSGLMEEWGVPGAALDEHLDLLWQIFAGVAGKRASRPG